LSAPRHDTPHVPGPSLWPIGFAIGVACLLVGLVISWVVAIIGAVLAVVFGLLWARDVTRDVRGEVPEVEPETRVVADEAAPAVVAVDEPLPGFPRSKFLEASLLGLSAALGGVLTLPVLGFMVLPSFTNVEEDEVDLGPIDNFPRGSFVIATYLANPAQGEVTRRTAFVRNNGEAESGEPSFTILYSRCVHLGCPVQPNGPIDEAGAWRSKAFSSCRSSRSRSAVRATAGSTTPRGPARRGRRCARWTGTRTRSATAASSSASSMPSAT
jgi:hypothetical protein